MSLMPSIANQKETRASKGSLLGRQHSLPLTCHTSTPNLNLPWRRSTIDPVQENQGQKPNTELP